MKGILLSIAVLVTSAVLPAANANDCRMEAVKYMEMKFGKTAKLMSIKFFTGSKGGRMLTAWATTNICDGNFVFDYGTTKALACEVPSYGKHYNQKLHRVYAAGECVNLLDHDDFPKLFE